MLERRVETWKGHDPTDFGALLLDDVFVVKRSNIDCKYQVSLFEKIIIFFKLAVTIQNKNPKGDKNGSFWKRSITQVFSNRSATDPSKKATPLLLKYRTSVVL